MTQSCRFAALNSSVWLKFNSQWYVEVFCHLILLITPARLPHEGHNSAHRFGLAKPVPPTLANFGVATPNADIQMTNRMVGQVGKWSEIAKSRRLFGKLISENCKAQLKNDPSLKTNSSPTFLPLSPLHTYRATKCETFSSLQCRNSSRKT